MLRYDSKSIIDQLDDGAAYGVYVSDEELKRNSDNLNRVFKELDIKAKVVKFFGGPAFSEYRLSVNDIESIDRISECVDVIREKMGVKSFRVARERRFGFRMREMTVEMANNTLSEVKLKDFYDDFRFRISSMMIPLGGGTYRRSVADLCDNILVGGDNKKEVYGFIDSTILSLLCTLTPRELKMTLAGSDEKDFKELDGMPHLTGPVIKDKEGFAGMISGLKSEIDERYEIFYESDTRSLIEYNRSARMTRKSRMLPRILCVISDLGYMKLNADDRKQLTDVILRGKNAGVHFLIATTVLNDKCLTSDIKDLIDARVSFKVGSKEESKVILDLDLATDLLGNGDLIYSTPTETAKVQSPSVSEEEMKRVTVYIRENQKELYEEKPRPVIRPYRETSDTEG